MFNSVSTVPGKDAPIGSQDPTTRVLLVDDHAVVREGIKLLLSMRREFEVVAEAGDGLEAIDKTLSHRPDVVVMDINMPRLNGLQALARIKDLMPHVPVVMLSMNDERRVREVATRLGAVAYVTKDSAAEVLSDAVRQAHLNCGVGRAREDLRGDQDQA